MTEHNQQSALLGKIASYTELLVNDPRSTIFVSLAETYRKMGLFNDARDIAAKGLEQHPDFGPAYVVLARIECQLQHFDASCAGFDRALALDPDSLSALVGYARVKLLLHREDEARDLLLHARSLSPADPVINKMLLGLSPQPVAEEESAPVIERVPPPAKNLTALASTTLADLYLAQGMIDKGLTLYRQLLTRNPDNLELRRKIREIEGRTEEPPVPSKEEGEASPSLPSNDQIADDQVEPAEFVDDLTLEVADSSTATIEQTLDDVKTDEQTEEITCKESVFEQATASDDPTEIISKLNNLLNNIRRRREHV